MLAFKLAYRNLIGAGLRTWLNVIVLSFSFVVIIWNKGILDGWNRQARRDTIAWEIGGGQYWHEAYDPYDPFTLQDSHGTLPAALLEMEAGGKAESVLIAQATMYPEGRMIATMLKGIDPDQSFLELPTAALNASIDEIPAVIGRRTAVSTRLEVGDFVTIRWRDTDGTFDAAEAKIVEIFKSDVPAIDNGQIWIPIERLRQMTRMEGEATLLVTHPQLESPPAAAGWLFKDQDFLLTDLEQMIRMKSVGTSIMFFILMALAMLAIFDTQVLSIWRRQKEIGTNIALGMTRGQVIRLFTIEGAMHAVLAAIVGAVYGIPFLALQAKHGFGMPQGTDDYGLTIAERIYPVFSIQLIVGVSLLVFITATVISYLPTRKIAKMNPTEAIRGKIQ
jgi:ABC-type lipoprotein release transport system permease subunit